MRIRPLAIAAVVLALGLAAPAAASPTCAGVGGIANHGEHIVGDYVTGLGGIGGGLGWPPGPEVGQTVAGNGGVVVRGGPGPGFHFPNGHAPGASFCIEQRPEFTAPAQFTD
jgi:hypothetical protein